MERLVNSLNVVQTELVMDMITVLGEVVDMGYTSVGSLTRWNGNLLIQSLHADTIADSVI